MTPSLPWQRAREAKTCGKCLESKSLEMFYKNSEAPDGRQWWCKQCQTSLNRRERDALYRLTEGFRKSQEKYRRSVKYRVANREYLRRQREEHREIYRARVVVSLAIESGRLIRPSSCSACGERQGRIEAHHPDYSRPLDVRWLCKRCHEDLHTKLATALRAAKGEGGA